MRRQLRVFLLIATCASLGACKQEVYKGLSERDANEMLAILLKDNLNASRVSSEGGKYAVKVPKESLGAAILILSRAGFPRESHKSMDDIFPGGKWVASPVEQRARLAYGLGQDLSRTMLGIKGITWARVHVALAQSDLRGAIVTPSTASVVLRVEPSASIAEIAEQARAVVSAGVEGLDPASVRIIMSPQSNASVAESR